MCFLTLYLHRCTVNMKTIDDSETHTGVMVRLGFISTHCPPPPFHAAPFLILTNYILSRIYQKKKKQDHACVIIPYSLFPIFRWRIAGIKRRRSCCSGMHMGVGVGVGDTPGAQFVQRTCSADCSNHKARLSL